MPLCSFRKEYAGHLQMECARADRLKQDGSMKASVAAKDLMHASQLAEAPCGEPAWLPRARRISVEAGHALEQLGHAIEYLTDEYVHAGGDCSADDPRIQAIQLLMAVNRQIYFACPEAQSFSERCRNWLHLRAA